RARVSRLRKRAHRFCGPRLAFAKLTRIVRAGANPAGLRGASVVGAQDRILKQLRASVGESIFGAARGRSRTIGFTLSPAPLSEPTFVANFAPLAFWAAAVRHRWVSEGDMVLVFESLSKGGEPAWQQVNGPTGAMLATLRRLGWALLRWDRWETFTGLVVDLREYGARAVKALVDAGAKDALLRDLSIRGEALGTASQVALFLDCRSISTECKLCGHPWGSK
ncbi:unnamed protein product, partial [Prorocentrum cordatum]